jgi:RimJ/RimL family protein N-acetyltransferase
MPRFDGLADVVLHSERLTLRPWRPEDADAVHAALRDDAEAHRLTSLPAPYTRAEAVRFVTEIGAAGRAAGTALDAALIERHSGDLVGSASLRITDNGEIGYLIYQRHRGNGYAAEATRVLAHWAFEHGLPRVYLLCAPANLASVRTALRAGFRFEGVNRGMRLPPADGRVSPRIADMARCRGPPNPRDHRRGRVAARRP